MHLPAPKKSRNNVKSMILRKVHVWFEDVLEKGLEGVMYE